MRQTSLNKFYTRAKTRTPVMELTTEDIIAALDIKIKEARQESLKIGASGDYEGYQECRRKIFNLQLMQKQVKNNNCQIMYLFK